jgi:lysophospholipase L1-like esterase
VRPALVTLGIGSNDLRRLVPVELFERNVTAVCEALRGCGAQVVVTEVPDLSLAPAATAAEAWLGVPRSAIAARAEALNHVLRALGRKEGVQVVDLLSFSRDELPRHAHYFSPDGFHPSAAGYARWAERMWPAVETIAQRWMASRETQL